MGTLKNNVILTMERDTHMTLFILVIGMGIYLEKNKETQRNILHKSRLNYLNI